MRTRAKRYMGLCLTLLVATTAAIAALQPTASALVGSQFYAHRIMDDGVFFSNGTMSMQEIQLFLQAKVPVCDTNGQQQHSSGDTRAAYAAARGYSAPFTCLKDYRQDVSAVGAAAGLCNPVSGGNKSAAQIIYEVAQSCGVNPKVLIVLLQKEQSLITDDWPWSIQYRSATGFGCPDTASCDAQYYGYFNQVYSAAKQFKRYAANASSYNFRTGRTSHVGYNPNASCGGSQVNIQTQATAALYNYTPYQPNSAALNNLYGSGDGCSAYGNRNFWRMFNDWFGPTVGPLVRTPDSGELFYSDGSNRYRVGSMDMAGIYGLGLGDVRIIPQSEMDTLPLASSPNTPDLSLVAKSNSDSDTDGGSIYLVTLGKRYHITSMDVLSDYGFAANDIGYMPLNQLERMPLVSTLSTVARNNEGILYKIDNGSKKGIFDFATYQQLDPSGTLSNISNYILARLNVGSAVLTQDLTLTGPDGRVWLAGSTGWRYITSMEAYSCLGLESLPNIRFTNEQSTIGTQTSSPSCLAETSGGQKYIMDNWRKIPVDADWGLTGFATLTDNTINRHVTYSPTDNPVFRTVSNGALYTLEGGKKHQIISMASFAANGHVANDIFTASTDFLASIPTGSYKLADGMIIRDADSGKLFIISGNTKYLIPNMTIFASYGYDAASIITLSSGSFVDYSTAGTVQSQIAKAPSATVFDSGIALRIPPALEVAYGVTGATPAYPAAIGSKGSERQASRYLKFGSSGQLYYMDNGQKRPVYSWDTFVALGGSVNNITGLSASAANLFPTGSPM